MTREDIKKVFEAQAILNANLYRHQVDPSDLTEADYVEDIFQVVNDDNYRQELKAENELG